MIKTLRAPESAHSRYSASGAHRWGNCPGSIALSEGKEDKGSKYAIEGTAAHALAADCLSNAGLSASDYLGVVVEVEQSGELHRVTVDSDMATHVQTYVDLVRSLAADGDLLVEQTVDYSEALGLPEGEGVGTSDTVVFGPSEIAVVDLKYGRGEEVEAVDNDQLLLYLAGAKPLAEALGGAPDADLRAIISQPRVSSEPSSWSVPTSAMRARLAELRQAVVLAEEARTPEVRRDPERMAKYLTPGEKQCRWCKAKATCPALATAVKQAVSGSPPVTGDAFAQFDPVPLSAADVVPPTSDSEEVVLSHMMHVAPLVESWLSAVRSEVERRLLDGRPVAGFKLVQGRAGSRKWTNEDEVEERLKKFRLKIEEMYDLKLISPTTAEKRSKEGIIGPRQWQALQPMIARAEGGLSVAPESDKRPAVSRAPVADAFAEFDASSLV
jgi:hypothetical protein